MTSARSILATPASTKASFSCCQLHVQGRLCTTTCGGMAPYLSLPNWVTDSRPWTNCCLEDGHPAQCDASAEHCAPSAVRPRPGLVVQQGDLVRQTCKPFSPFDVGMMARATLA